VFIRVLKKQRAIGCLTVVIDDGFGVIYKLYMYIMRIYIILYLNFMYLHVFYNDVTYCPLNLKAKK